MSLPKLDFRLLSSTTSEQSIGSLNELKKPLSKSKGWHSEKYCKYPQNIYIAFETPINLRQINLLSHEKKISQKISFYAYCPQGDISIKDYQNISYLNFGYIKLNDNSDNNFKAREFKKIFVDVKCLYLRIDLDKNYTNGYNPFNQVSLINIEFFGYKLPGYKNSLINIEITDENLEKLEDLSPRKGPQRNFITKTFADFLDDICGEKLKELNSKLSENTKNQNSNECFRIKECINEVSTIGKKLYELQIQKEEAVKSENFDKAMELKSSIDILYNQLNKIDLDKKGNKINKRRNSNSGKKNNSNFNSGNNSFLDPDDNLLEEIKEENENEPDNNQNHNTKKRLSINTNNSNNTMMMNINELNQNNNNYNMTNYSSLFNNTKSIDLSKGKIINNEDRKNPFEINDEELVDYDEVIIPTLKNKVQVTKSTEEMEQENEEMYKIKLGPLEELKRQDLENYEILIEFIDEDGLRKVLSGQYKYKIMGYNILSRKLKDMFADENKEKIFYTLIKLIAQLIEDKKTPLNMDLLEIILNIFEHLNKNINEIDLSREYIYLINDRILSKVILKLNDSSDKIRKKSFDILIFALINKIIYFDLLINSLISNDIKNTHSSNSFSILSKLDIIQNILDNYNEIINKITSNEEHFPKDLIVDYIILNISSTKKEIKEKSRLLMDQGIDKFGLNIFKQKLMNFKLKDLEKLKITNLKPLLDNIKEINTNLNFTSDYTVHESLSKMKLQESGKKKSKSKSKSKSRGKSKEKEKDDNYNKCSLCKIQIGNNENIMEHMKKCDMCYQCKKCKVIVEIKNLTQHRLNECNKKDKFKLCQRCKEAIPIESYEEHVKNNKCNEYKKNCNRCPLCHEDIPLSKDGFYTHLIKHGCPYKLKYKNIKKKGK